MFVRRRPRVLSYSSLGPAQLLFDGVIIAQPIYQNQARSFPGASVDTISNRHLELTVDFLEKEHLLQPRDALTENLATHFNDRTISFDEPRQFPLARRTAAVIAAWLVPGAGHLVLGKNGRALLFFITIAGAFALGLVLSGHLYWPTPDPASTVGFDLITVLWFFTQVGSGLCYIVSYLLGLGTASIPQAAASPTFEYGNTFMILAGLLNYLVVYDAFDIAAGRKR